MNPKYIPPFLRNALIVPIQTMPSPQPPGPSLYDLRVLQALFGSDKLYPVVQTSEYKLLRLLYSQSPERFDISMPHNYPPHYTIQVDIATGWYMYYHCYIDQVGSKTLFKNLTTMDKNKNPIIIAEWMT